MTKPDQDREDFEAFGRLLVTAKLLYANAEWCAVNHYGADFEIHGLPGWLAGCRADIEAAQAALAHERARAQGEPVAVPAGWKLVPVEVTDEMKSSVRANGGVHALAFALAAWPDLLAAAPVAPPAPVASHETLPVSNKPACVSSAGDNASPAELAKDFRVVLSSAPPAESGEVEAEDDDWSEDPTADERWNTGCDYAMQQLCTVLGVEQESVEWEAATETVDGDVQAVLRNILDAGLGEDWRDRTTAPPPEPAKAEVAAALDELGALVYGGVSKGGASLARALKVVRTALATPPTAPAAAEVPPSAADQPDAWWAETGTSGAREGCNKPFWLRHEAIAYVRRHGGHVAPLFRRWSLADAAARRAAKEMRMGALSAARSALVTSGLDRHACIIADDAITVAIRALPLPGEEA